MSRQKNSHISIRFNSEIRDLVEDYLCLDRSTKQVSNYLKLEYGKAVSVMSIFGKKELMVVSSISV
jgi:hypothetical protein